MKYDEEGYVIELDDGTVVDDAYCERIVKEMDQAFDEGRLIQIDPKTWLPVPPRPGRPSLTGEPAKSPHVGFRVTPELRAQAAALAAKQGISVSALARQALEEYVRKTG